MIFISPKLTSSSSSSTTTTTSTWCRTFNSNPSWVAYNFLAVYWEKTEKPGPSFSTILETHHIYIHWTPHANSPVLTEEFAWYQSILIDLDVLHLVSK
jgi:hypothetical protein